MNEPRPDTQEEPSTDLNARQLRALAAIPSGSIAVAGVAILLLLLAWLAIYLFVYLPRGMVG
jgi:hypothetical protein